MSPTGSDQKVAVWIAWTVGVFVLLTATILVSTPSGSEPVLDFAGGITSSSSAEERLAAIDQQSPVIRMGSEAPYRRTLDLLAQRCTEERSIIGDLAVSARATLRSEAGTDLSVLQVLQGAARAVPSGRPRTSCAEIFDVLATSTVRTR